MTTLLFVNILPADHAGDSAFVKITPYAEYYKVDNRIMTTPAGTGPRRVYITREPGGSQLSMLGNIPVDDPGANEALAIEDPAEFAAQVFRQMLEQRGIVVYGRTKTKHTELATLSTFTITASAPANGGGARSALTAPSSADDAWCSPTISRSRCRRICASLIRLARTCTPN